MDAPTSLPKQPDFAPRNAHRSWWGWVLLLTPALVVALPIVYLAFFSGPVTPAVSSAPAFVTSGPSANEVTISGEVLHPGRYPLLAGDGVASAVLRAGGLTSSAKDTVKVIRNVPKKGNVTLVVNLRKVLTKPIPGNDIALMPGDAIIIGQRLIKF